jgi:acetylornithine/N-succinyldiaminopimelate aminotransferase
MIPAVMPTYARADIAFSHGEGVYLFDADKGQRYLDFCAGIAVNALGHSHPHLVELLRQQAGKLWHTSNLYRIPEQERLAQRLVDHSFANTVFFCNSGAEAVEGGIKLVRRYQSSGGNPERWRIITCADSFHGRTLATLAAAANPKHVDGFGPMADGFDQVPFGNLNELRAAITKETAAILVEPVQGEGGMNTPDAQFLQGLRATADEFGLLLFLDEVQSGIGRTGKLWAYEWGGIEPDVVAAAKGIGGGFPMGAVLATEDAARGMTAGLHGSTFGGNQLAMAASHAVLDVLLGDGFLDQVDAVARDLQAKLDGLVQSHPDVFESWRGMGLMLGLKCVVPNLEMMARLREAGLLTVVAADNVLRLLPPLTIKHQHVDDAVAILDQVASEWTSDGG